MAAVTAPSGPPAGEYVAPAAVPYREKELYIQRTPVWMIVLRAAQVLLAFIILILAGVLMHGKVLDANAYSVACTVFTWIVVGYVLVTEKVPSANAAYNIWAVLALDLFLAILWLASCGANAALRARFKYDVNVQCYNDGSMVNSNHCFEVKRAAGHAKRDAVASDEGLAMMSAIAGLSALVWLLFIATLVFHGHTFRLWHQANKKPSNDNAAVESKAQVTPMLGPEAAHAAPAYPQYSDQQQYQPQCAPHAELHSQSPPPHAELQGYQQQTAGYPPQQAAPYQLAGYQPGQPGAQAYAAHPDPSQAQYNNQQGYVSPTGTPAPGQAYYPPPQSTVSALSGH